MAQPHSAGYNPSSPHSSSGGADSYKHEGTPDTRLTAFSPDENSAKSSKLFSALSLSASKTQPVKFPVSPYRSTNSQLDKDPFISSSSAASQPEQKLSATASVFRPFSTPIIANGSGEATPRPETACLAGSHQSFSSVSSQLSGEIHLSRCLVVFSATAIITVPEVEGYLAKFEQLGSPCSGTKQLQAHDGHVCLRFSDIRDACMVHRNIQLSGANWEAEFISPDRFTQITIPGIQAGPVQDGQLLVLAQLLPGANLSASQVESTIFDLLLSEGDLFAFHRQAGIGDAILRAVVEYCDANVALAVLSKHNGTTIQAVQLILSPYRSDQGQSPLSSHGAVASPTQSPLQSMTSSLQGISLSRTQLSEGPVVAPNQQAQVPQGVQIQPHYALYQPLVYRTQLPVLPPVVFDHQIPRSHSVASSSTIPLLGQTYPQLSTIPLLPLQHDLGHSRPPQNFNRPESRRQNAMRVNRSPFFNAAGHHNHVDVSRIREGIDVRTTIMLRNIPNKVDQAMLKRIIDESSWGKYDFMYLRIDFANDCNVGYAFINFVDPLDIIDFVNARGNQRWNCFKSDKVAEISYATIQGKDCLIQKFRNSSVMLEAEHYRPKLFYTSNGPVPELAGQEEPFPGPDNQSKMKRSCENAEHVGLFTPNAGQHYRDEQRRRRSQFDRGTRLAALEEYDYDTAIQQLYTP